MVEDYGNWMDWLLCCAIILFISVRMPTPSSDLMETSSNKGLLPLAESPITWGAIGVLIGAIASVAPGPALRYLFIFTWLVFVGALIRHNIFAKHAFSAHRPVAQVTGNIVAALIIALALLWLIKILPRPKEPATAEEIAGELCERSPWICTKPPEAKSPEFVPAQHPMHQAACHFGFVTTTEPVARLYTRHDIGGVGAAIPFEFQELFYQWTASFSLNRETARLLITISHLSQSDMIKVIPSAAHISGPVPEWFSGFQETARTKPDYYSTKIIANDLAQGEKVIVTVRRPLDTPEISSTEMVRIKDARTEHCSALIPRFDENAEVKTLNTRILSLANFKMRGTTQDQPRALPLGRDPGDIPANQLQATIELRCSNADCTRVTASNLEVHKGSSPN